MPQTGSTLNHGPLQGLTETTTVMQGPCRTTDMEQEILGKKPPGVFCGFPLCPLGHGLEARGLPPLPPAWCPALLSLDSPASLHLAPLLPRGPEQGGEPTEGASLRAWPAPCPPCRAQSSPTLSAFPNLKYSVTRGGTSSCTLASGHRCGCISHIL